MSKDQTSENARASSPRIYSADLTLSLQRVLAALADIEVGYDRDIDRLRHEVLPEPRRLQIARELDRQRRQDREALLRRLEELSSRRQVA